MNLYRWVRPALNWRVGLLALGLVFVVEYGALNHYRYYKEMGRSCRISHWTGHIELLRIKYDPHDRYPVPITPVSFRWVRMDED